jgi:hypothetical protein
MSINRRKEITAEIKARYGKDIVGKIRIRQLMPGVWEAMFNFKAPVRSHCVIVYDYRSNV